MVEKWGSREDACPNLKVTERYMESTWLIEMTWNLNPRQGQSGNGEEIVGKQNEAEVVIVQIWLWQHFGKNHQVGGL